MNLILRLVTSVVMFPFVAFGIATGLMMEALADGFEIGSEMIKDITK